MLRNAFSPNPARGAQDQLDVAAFIVGAESRAVLEQFVGAAGSVSSHIQTGGVRDAIGFLKTAALPPKLLIVDVSGVELPLSEIDALAEVCEPSVRVLVVGDRQDIGLFRALLRLGVADYLVKPLHAALLAPHFNGAPALAVGAADARSGKLVVVSGACGGVGATTVAVNLSWHLATKDCRHVALVDLDLYGQAAALQLNLGSGGLIEALRNADQLDPQFLKTALVRSDPRLALLNGDLDWEETVESKAEQLGDVVKVLKKHHHYVVVDLPRRPGPGYTFLMRQADIRVLVTNRTLTSARDCGRMLDLSENGGGRSILVLNEDRPASNDMLAAAALEDALHRKIDVRIPYQRQASGQVDTAARPLAAVNRTFGQAIDALAAALSGRSPVAAGGWRRILRRA